MFGPLNHVLGSAGKRIRVELLELSFQMAGGTDGVPVSVIEFVELLHGGSLVIDDIEDDSDWRRGKPTLHRVIGVPLAINTGNWMYFSALEKLHDLPLDAVAKNRIMAESLAIIRRCHEGQALDLAARVVEMERRDFYPTAIAISEMKTGGLSGLAASLGVALAGASSNLQKVFYSFGMHLGVGLQMQNDFQELKRGATCDGRSDDLRNGRVTWPWAWASQLASEHEFKELQRLLADSCSAGLHEVASKLLEIVAEACEPIIRKQISGAVLTLEKEIGSGSSEIMNQLVSRIEQYHG